MTTAATEQTAFDFLLPYSAARKLLQPREVAVALGRELSHVYTLIDEGRLEAHGVSGREKERYMITRRSVLAVLAETAKYEPADLVPRLAELLATLTREQYQAALTKAGELRAKL